MATGTRITSIGSATPAVARSGALQVFAQQTTTGASTGPSLVSTPATRPLAVRMAVTVTPSRSRAPRSSAAAISERVVATASTAPLSDSYAAQTMSSTRSKGCNSCSCAAVTTSVWMPMRRCIATFAYMRATFGSSGPV